MALEIECKLYVTDLEVMRQKLQASGAVIEHERTYEHNLRFLSKHHDFFQEQIVLRLRQDDAVRLTYKSPLASLQAGAKTRLELETTVGNLQTMRQILEKLGFYPYMIYEKYRTTYHFPQIAETELVLDEMPFGNFIEVEGTGIEEVLQLLGMAHEPRILYSYAQLFEQVKERHGLEFVDLSFENFRGIRVDSTVFQSEQ